MTPGLAAHRLDGDQRRLGVAGVLAGLDDEEVDPALEQPARLLGEARHQLVEGDAAGDADRLVGGAHGADDEARPIGGGELVAASHRELGGAPVELPRPVGQAVLGEHDRRAAEGVGLDEIGAGLEIGAVDIEDDIGPGHDEVLVAALELDAAEVLGSQISRLWSMVPMAPSNTRIRSRMSASSSSVRSGTGDSSCHLSNSGLFVRNCEVECKPADVDGRR